MSLIQYLQILAVCGHLWSVTHANTSDTVKPKFNSNYFRLLKKMFPIGETLILWINQQIKCLSYATENNFSCNLLTSEVDTHLERTWTTMKEVSFVVAHRNKIVKRL